MKERESRPAARTAASHRHTRTSGQRAVIWLLWSVIGAPGVWLPTTAHSQNTVITINNELINDARLTSGLLIDGPPEVAREMAIVDAAMFDAANAASGLIYPTVAYTGPAVSGVSVNAAALSAGYTALEGIFANAIWSGEDGSATIQAAVLGEINATYASALNGLGIPQSSNTPNLSACASPSGSLISLCGGIALGTTAGNDNLAARGYTIGNNNALDTADGSATAILNGINNPYTPPNNNPGTYIPPTNRPAMFPQWGTVEPSGLTSSQMTALENAIPPALPVNSAAYAQNLLQTECQGAGSVLPAKIQSACLAAGFSPETTAQATAALFWNDPGTTFTPPGHWLAITNSLATSQNLSTLQTARLSSLVSDAVNDAGIATWETKYSPANLVWRPVTAIQDCANWNPNFTTCDPTWSSLIATPPHPDYLAGHPAFSGAAATVLENFFNTDIIPVTSTSDAYCNGGGPLRASPTGPIIACIVTPASTNGLAFVYNDGPTIYAPASACGTLGGTLVMHGSKAYSCTIGTTTYLFNPNAAANGCNDIVNPGGTNDSLLICQITEVFPTISDASQGPNGAEFSRVVGGIHTPIAVEEAISLGNAIGQTLASENNIPEPGALRLLVTSFVLLAGLRYRRPARATPPGRAIVTSIPHSS